MQLVLQLNEFPASENKFLTKAGGNQETNLSCQAAKAVRVKPNSSDGLLL